MNILIDVMLLLIIVFILRGIVGVHTGQQRVLEEYSQRQENIWGTP